MRRTSLLTLVLGCAVVFASLAVLDVSPWASSVIAFASNLTGTLVLLAAGPMKLRACADVLNGAPFMTGGGGVLCTEMPAVKLPLSIAAIEWAESHVAEKDAAVLIPRKYDIECRIENAIDRDVACRAWDEMREYKRLSDAWHSLYVAEKLKMSDYRVVRAKAIAANELDVPK